MLKTALSYVWFLSCKKVSILDMLSSHVLIMISILALGYRMPSGTAVDWALESRKLMENLKEAIMGNYRAMISLTSVLENGAFNKKLLDELIDECKSSGWMPSWPYY